MLRRIGARYLLSLMFVLSMAAPTAGAAGAAVATDAGTASVAAASGSSGAAAVPVSEVRPGDLLASGNVVGAADALAAVDGPSHHFGFEQASVLGQATPNVPVGLSGLQRLTTINVPGWTATNAPSFDVCSSDLVRNINYVAARNPGGPTVGNSSPGLLAIDTTTNTLIGELSVPDCDAVNVQRASFQCPSGVEVMPDLRKVAVTSRGNAGQNFVEIFDIGASPTNAPMLTRINLPNNQLQPDELTYDPINHRLYVANTGGAFFLAVIDAVTNTLLGQISVTQFCPTTMEQPRFDPVDGMIYQNCSADQVLLRIDPNAGAFGQIVSAWSTPSQENGIDVDPLTNHALLGSNPGPQAVVNLNAPSTLAVPLAPIPVVASFPQVNATDGLYFNNNTLRWYTGSSGNTNLGVPCPASPLNPAQRPVLGVFQGATISGGTPSIVGVECTGNGAHTAGVDPIRNQIYVPAGAPVIGILVFKDNSASQGLTGAANATLGSNGTVGLTPSGGNTTVQATLTGVSGGGTIQLLVVTTVGNQVVPCASTGGTTTVTCNGTVLGLPLAGAPVTLSRNGAVVVKGNTTSGTVPPTTLTAQQAIAQAQALPGFVTGQQGVPCTHVGGGPCTGNANGLQVSGIQTSSMTWTVTATLPPAPPAGAGTPFFVINTTAGVGAVPCTGGPAGAPAPGSVVNCTATTVGNAFQGAAAVLVFPGVGGAAGPAVGPAIVTGPGPAAAVAPAAAAALPLLPPPPPVLLPPPPSPLLPPPPPAPAGAISQRAAFPEVPVIPEADSLPLLLSGLAALGALAGWRARRRRQD